MSLVLVSKMRNRLSYCSYCIYRMVLNISQLAKNDYLDLSFFVKLLFV